MDIDKKENQNALRAPLAPEPIANLSVVLSPRAGGKRLPQLDHQNHQSQDHDEDIEQGADDAMDVDNEEEDQDEEDNENDEDYANYEEDIYGESAPRTLSRTSLIFDLTPFRCSSRSACGFKAKNAEPLFQRIQSGTLSAEMGKERRASAHTRAD